jgi:hypothetical protein
MNKFNTLRRRNNPPDTVIVGWIYPAACAADADFLPLDECSKILDNIYIMNLDKLKENVDSTKVVEELIILSRKVFSQSSDDVKDVIEMFITKSYKMGKKNMVKTIDD